MLFGCNFFKINSRCFELIFCCFFFFSADDSVHHLDQVIQHWIYKVPNLIDDAVFVSEKDTRLVVAKRVTQVRNKIYIFQKHRAHWARMCFYFPFWFGSRIDTFRWNSHFPQFLDFMPTVQLPPDAIKKITLQKLDFYGRILAFCANIAINAKKLSN